jgi:23S rRNA pseudouridine1911/1915/1917 synthase
MPSFGIVFEDDDVIVVDKPSGVVVHPAGGVREPTLVDAIAASGRPLAARAGVDRPGVVHRLDRDVSGLLLVAKTDSAHERLVADLAARDVHRTYLALVAGVPQVDEGKIEAPVGRHPRHRTRMTVLADGKPSVTWFRVLETFGDVALLELRLETGRTHQIRTHLASIGHPILGDAAYGVDPRSAAALGALRPLLHAVGLSLRHPISGAPLEFSSPLPEDLSACLDLLRSR